MQFMGFLVKVLGAPYCDCLAATGACRIDMSTVAPKRWAKENKISGLFSGFACHATREIPFGAIEAAQWLTTRTVETSLSRRASLYVPDRPTN